MIRQSRLVIKSRDRIAGGTSTNFSIDLEPPITGVKKVELVAASIPHAMYVVNSSNNSLRFFDDASPKTATIPVGNYVPSTLAPAVKAAMDAVGTQVYDVSYNETTGKLSFSAAGNFVLILSESSAADLLGFISTDTISTTSHMSDRPINLSEPNLLYINVDPIGSIENRTTQRNHRFTFVVPVDVNSTEIINYAAEKQFKQEVCYNGPLDHMNISLWRGFNVLADLNGFDWHMILNIYHE